MADEKKMEKLMKELMEVRKERDELREKTMNLQLQNERLEKENKELNETLSATEQGFQDFNDDARKLIVVLVDATHELSNKLLKALEMEPAEENDKSNNQPNA